MLETKQFLTNMITGFAPILVKSKRKLLNKLSTLYQLTTYLRAKRIPERTTNIHEN